MEVITKRSWKVERGYGEEEKLKAKEPGKYKLVQGKESWLWTKHAYISAFGPSDRLRALNGEDLIHCVRNTSTASDHHGPRAG